jgi:hypothetical protein
VARHIPNVEKLIRILDYESQNRPADDPFVFSMNESLRIRQLIGESLVSFFAKLNDLPDPGPQRIPEGTPGTTPKSKKKRKRYT